MARYLYGIRYSPRDLRFALAEASEGRSTMALEKILLFCYHYDPKAGAYVWFALNLMRGGGILTVITHCVFPLADVPLRSVNELRPGSRKVLHNGVASQAAITDRSRLGVRQAHRLHVHGRSSG